MHDAAKKWDRENPRPVPEGRPCDWCGRPVPRGYIHPECAEKETELYMDIFY
jgi:CRISPR/Cas system-associated protein Cas10 (large subunit of type III CRISPR-Cas system)